VSEREPIEHQSIYKDGHQDWRLGYSSECDECEGYRLAVLMQFPHRTDTNDRVAPVYADSRYSTSPKVEKFFATGDPSVFAKPGALDYEGD
jgi:hypothetical protein